MFLFELFPLNSLLLCLSTQLIYGQKHKIYELFYVGFSIWEKKSEINNLQCNIPCFSFKKFTCMDLVVHKLTHSHYS